ncbi:MAG: ABC transporter permease [Nitrospinota bacterium]|nr:ABC transporter permease [Nitrospinota bacterium]
MKRLILVEIEKLVRSSVFWVAPIVLIFFLGLMLFGFEVYAAKNGIDKNLVKSGMKTFSDNDKMTGSAVVSSFVAVQKIGLNLLNIVTFGRMKAGNTAAVVAEQDEDIIELKPGEDKGFDYFGTFFKSLFNPKSLPRPGCDCTECPDKNEKPDNGNNVLGRFLDFISVPNAYAVTELPARKPPVIDKRDSFVERIQKRVVWLVDTVKLENMLIDRSRFNGLRFTYLSLYFSFVFVFPLLTVSVVAQLFAVEFSQGTIRTIFLNPISRGQYLASKLIVVSLYLASLMMFFIFTTMLVGVVFAGYGNLILDSELIGDIGETRMILGDGAILLFMLCIPVAAISFFPLAALAILVSYIRPEPSTVIGMVTIIYFILFTLGGLPLFEDIRFLFFTSYMDGWTLLFRSPFQTAEFVYKFLAVALMTLGAIITINYLSKKRDIYE